jgi:hypothetical protein
LPPRQLTKALLRFVATVEKWLFDFKKSVKSGYRVTLTYNLHFAPEEPADIIVPTPPSSQVESKNALSYLADSGVMPEGGYLGFGLRHEYPVNSKIGNVCLVVRLDFEDFMC